MKSSGDFSETSLTRSWNEAAQKVKPYHQAPSTRIYFDQEKNLIDAHLSPLEGKKFFKTDLWNESKNTQILKHVVKEGATVYGIDISPFITRQAFLSFNHSENRPRMMTADIRKLPYKDNTFDYIYSMGTVEHFPETEKAIQELYRVLKQGGTAIIGVPNKHDLFLRPLLVFVMQKLRLYSFGYEKSFSKKELRRMLEKANFEVEGYESLLFMPGILRILDIFLFLHMKPLTKLSKILLAPFVFLYNRFPFFKQKGYLIACVARKRKDG
jgi:SAM-dependent methyltransferase